MSNNKKGYVLGNASKRFVMNSRFTDTVVSYDVTRNQYLNFIATHNLPDLGRLDGATLVKTKKSVVFTTREIANNYLKELPIYTEVYPIARIAHKEHSYPLVVHVGSKMRRKIRNVLFHYAEEIFSIIGAEAYNKYFLAYGLKADWIGRALEHLHIDAYDLENPTEELKLKMNKTIKKENLKIK